jgi:general secretion pathway protein C
MSYPVALWEPRISVSAAAWYEELKTGPGWSRLLEQRGAQLVVAVLLIALAMDCALILTRALSQASLPPPGAGSAGPAPPKRAMNPAVELATVINTHLFGVAGAQSGSGAPPTTMPLILAGVIADKDPAKGQAIIGDTAAAGKLFAVGAVISGGAHLHAVYGDRVLIERNGRLETLMLPRTPSKNAPVAPLPTKATVALQDNASVLAGLVRVQPVFNQGKLSGYRIFPGASHGTSAFNQLGLRAGDLIIAVNGTALDDAGKAMDVLQTLSSSATATVTVSRNGQPQELNLNLANLNTDSDTPAADNSTGAGGVDQSVGSPGPLPLRGVPRGASAQGAPGGPGSPPGSATTAPGDAPQAANGAGGAGSER